MNQEIQKKFNELYHDKLISMETYQQLINIVDGKKTTKFRPMIKLEESSMSMVSINPTSARQINLELDEPAYDSMQDCINAVSRYIKEKLDGGVHCAMVSLSASIESAIGAANITVLNNLLYGVFYLRSPSNIQGNIGSQMDITKPFYIYISLPTDSQDRADELALEFKRGMKEYMEIKS